MFPLKSFYPQLFVSKTDQTPQADVPNPFVSFLNTFFLCFKEKSISVCITVLYYIIILIAVFSKSLSRQFVKNSISIALFSKARYLRYKKWRETMLPPLDNYSVPDSLTIKEFSYILLGY